MTELDQLISIAFESNGNQNNVNKVYLALLRSPLFIPVEKNPSLQLRSDLENEEEPFKPLFAKIDDKYFILAFDTLSRLTEWAGEEFSRIHYVEISGRELISGINDGVYLCLNLGSTFYKEFSPDEVKHLKVIVSRINQLKGEV